MVKKAVILAGGYGTRLAEETSIKPKPLVEIGGLPILWHIMKIYYQHNITEFVVCLGYKGYMIKEYFSNYHLHNSDVTFDFASGATVIHNRRVEQWSVTLVDTGEHSMTGGRLKRAREFIGDATFCMTYGDGVGDVDISAVIDQHKRTGVEATMTVVAPPGRFGAVEIEGHTISGFREKPASNGGWINAGFFVLEPSAIDKIDGDETVWEREPLERLAATRQLAAYRHEGFWQPMDTLREKQQLEDLWSRGRAPWRIWT